MGTGSYEQRLIVAPVPRDGQRDRPLEPGKLCGDGTWRYPTEAYLREECRVVDTWRARMLHGEEGYLGDWTLTQLVCLGSDEILLADLVCLFVGLLDSSLYSE